MNSLGFGRWQNFIHPIRKQREQIMVKEDLIGQKFGRLTVISRAEPLGVNERSAWNCLCECGNKKAVLQSHLKSGHTRSCGCLITDINKEKAYKLWNVNIKYTPEEASARKVWKTRYNDGDLLFEDFLIMSQKNCYYCGESPNNNGNTHKYDSKSSKFAVENGDFIYNGLDRINSSLPHDKENLIPCCKFCNWSKSDQTIEEFLCWIEKLYQKLFKE